MVWIVLSAGYVQDRYSTKPILSDSPPEQKIVEFYKSNYPTAKGVPFIPETAFWTRYYARKIGTEEHFETMLSMWHRESAFDPKTDDGDSIGVTQTRRRYFKRLRKQWLKLGVTLPSIKTVQTQCAFGVLEFKQHLGYAKGDEIEAIRRYNGSGWRAKRYQKRVLRSRRIIFQIPEPEGAD